MVLNSTGLIVIGSEFNATLITSFEAAHTGVDMKHVITMSNIVVKRNADCFLIRTSLLNCFFGAIRPEQYFNIKRFS